MYPSFFGLKENPFSMTPDPHFLYLGKNHQEALSRLVYGIWQKKGFIAMTGEVGTGKTTLIHYLLHKLSGVEHTKTAFLFNPKLPVNDFFAYILKDLGVNGHGNTKGDHVHALYQDLLQSYQKGQRVVLFVDEAQGLSPELLEEIRLLSNLETGTSKLLQIILIGQPELNKTLLKPEFRQLRQRINLRYHLRPLSEKETKEYIEKSLRIAGAKRSVFTKQAIKEIYDYSGGMPRLINILCDNSLLGGYSSNRRIIDRKLVKEAAKELQLTKSFLQTWRWILLAIFVIGGLLSFILLSKHFGSFGGEFWQRLQNLGGILEEWITNLF
jgi:general secretion pathway protein A